MTLPPFPIVALTWDDAHAQDATKVFTADQLDHKPISITTVGWLLRHDSTGSSIACEYCGDGDFRGITFVPKELVRDTVQISAAKRPRKASNKPPTKDVSNE